MKLLQQLVPRPRPRPIPVRLCTPCRVFISIVGSGPTVYTRQSLHTTTQLLQGSSGTTAEVWSNYPQDKVYIV